MINSWSFSSLQVYERCPYAASLPYQQTSSEAAQRGIDVHKKIELFLGGDDASHPDFAFDWGHLRSRAPIVEAKWGFDQLWDPCNYYESWLKIKPDTTIVTDDEVLIIDYKTGKREHNEIKHIQQLQLYLCGAAKIYPNRKMYRGEDWYLDEGKICHGKSYTQSQLDILRQRWHARGLVMTEAKEFPARPSKSNCRFCPHTTCEYRYEAP